MLKCSHHNFPHDLGNYCIQNCTVGKTNWQSVKKNSDRIDQVFIVMFKAEHEHRILYSNTNATCTFVKLL